MGSEGNREAVCAVEVLIPANRALVAIELEAEFAACQQILSYLCSAINRSNGIEVVAVTVGSRTAAEGVAVACARTFGQFAGGKAVV